MDTPINHGHRLQAPPRLELKCQNLWREARLKGKRLHPRALKPHNAIIPAMSPDGWSRSTLSDRIVGMDEYIRARSDITHCPMARCVRPRLLPGCRALRLRQCSSAHHADRPAGESYTGTTSRIAGFGGAQICDSVLGDAPIRAPPWCRRARRRPRRPHPCGAGRQAGRNRSGEDLGDKNVPLFVRARRPDACRETEISNSSSDDYATTSTHIVTRRGGGEEIANLLI